MSKNKIYILEGSKGPKAHQNLDFVGFSHRARDSPSRMCARSTSVNGGPCEGSSMHRPVRRTPIGACGIFQNHFDLKTIYADTSAASIK